MQSDSTAGGPQGQPPPPPPPPGGGGQGGGQQNNGLGIAAMVVGIVSIPLACCFGIGFLPGVVGAVLGFLGKQKADRGEAGNRGQAMAGLICGIIGAGLSLLWFILWLGLGVIDATVWTTTT